MRRQQLDYEIPKPKFAIQGSYIYGTLNAPENPPIQQVDIDLGMYLPFSTLGDGVQPKTAAKYYFDQVTSILENYIAVNRKSWVLQQKDTCIRIVLDAKTHIDIPLYAVPEGELNRVTEERRKNPVTQDHLPQMIQDDALFLEGHFIDSVSHMLFIWRIAKKDGCLQTHC